VPRTLRKAAITWKVCNGMCSHRSMWQLKLQISDVFQFYVAGGFKQSRSGILVNLWSQAYQSAYQSSRSLKGSQSTYTQSGCEYW